MSKVSVAAARNTARLSVMLMAIVKLQEILDRHDYDDVCDRVLALTKAVDCSELMPGYENWVNQVRALPPFCSLSLAEESMVYWIMYRVVDYNFGTVKASIETEHGRLYPSLFSQDVLPGEKFPISPEILNDLPD